MIKAYQLGISVETTGDANAVRKLKNVDDAVDKTASGKSKLSSIVGGLSSSFTSLLNPATAVVGALGSITSSVGAVSGSLFALAKQTSDAGSLIFDLTQKTGLSAEAISAFKFAADQSGAGIEELADGVIRFEKTVAEAARGSEQAKEKLKRLGLDPQEALKDLEGSLNKVMGTIARAPEGFAQVTLAQDAFGKSGANLIDIAESVDGNLQELIARAKELGLVFSEEDARAADEFGDQLTVLSNQVKGVGYQFALGFLPDITNAMSGASDAIRSHQDTVKEWGEATGDTIRGAIRTWQTFESIVHSATGNSIADIANLISYMGLLGLTIKAIQFAGTKSIGQVVDEEINKDRGLLGTAGKGEDANIFNSKGSSKKSPRQSAVEEMSRMAEALRGELSLLQAEKTALQTGVQFTNEKKLAVQLLSDKYKLLTEAEKERLTNQQKEIDSTKAWIESFNLGRAYLEELDTAIAKSSKGFNEYGFEVASFLVKLKTLGYTPKTEDLNLIKQKISVREMNELLVIQQEKYEEILGIEKSQIEIVEGVIGKLKAAGFVVDELAEKEARRLAIQNDFLMAMDKMAERRKEMLETLPIPPTVSHDPITADKPTESVEVYSSWETVVRSLTGAFGDLLEGIALVRDESGKLHFSLEQVFTTIAGLGLQAFEQLGAGLGQMVESWALYGDEAEFNLRKMVAGVLAQVARIATTYAVLCLAAAALAATGFGSLLLGGTPKDFLIAAALFGAVAVGAAGAARLVAGNSFQSSSQNQISSSSQQGGGDTSISRNTGNRSAFINEGRLSTGGRDVALLRELASLRQSNQEMREAFLTFADSMNTFETAQPGDILQKGARQSRGFITETVHDELSTNHSLVEKVARRLLNP